MRFAFTLVAILLGSTMLCCSAGGAHAQVRQNAGQIREYRIKFLEERLALTEEQQKQFSPVYREYERERFQLLTERKSLTLGFMAKSDAQLEEAINQLLALKQQELDLEKKYMKQFLQILSPRQVAALLQGENQFRKFLLERFGQLTDD